MLKTLFTLMMTSSLITLLHAWEDDPRIAEDNKKTDYLLKLGNKQAEEEDEETVALMAYAFRARNKTIEETPSDE
jgi:hypothetical protein